MQYLTPHTIQESLGYPMTDIQLAIDALVAAAARDPGRHDQELRRGAVDHEVLRAPQDHLVAGRLRRGGEVAGIVPGVRLHPGERGGHATLREGGQVLGLLLRRPAEAQRARVLSIYSLAVMGAGVVGAPAAGMLAAALGPLGALAFAGVAMLVFVGLVALLTPVAGIESTG